MKKIDEPFAVVIVKDQDWRLLDARFATNPDNASRINADANTFPNSRRRRVSLLVREKRIVGLCLARYQSRSADVDHMIALHHLRRLTPELDAQRFVSHLRNEFRREMTGLFQSGGLLGRKLTDEVVDLLSQDMLSLGILNELQALLGELPRLESDAALRRAEQRDAMALALEAAGVDSRKALPGVERDASDLRPFMSGLRHGAVREAAVIRHDATQVPGWLRSADSEAQWDCAVFADPKNNKDRITVTYADKEKLEEVTGTDLVYFRTHQPGYVLVQYKRMVGKNGTDEVYRPDATLLEEIRRMRAIAPASKDWLHSPADYRLSPEPFYVKVVDSQVTRRETNKLAEGMYFPLALFEEVLQSEETLGPRGGRVLSRRSTPKHLSNELFIQLLKGGWIGTVGSGTDQMSEMIRALLDQGRGVTIAEDHRDPNDAWGNRAPFSDPGWLEF